MAKSLETVPDIKPSWWKKIGDDVADKIRVHVQKSKKDINDRAFKKYSSEYAEAKSMGVFKRQSSKSIKPDLTLTGDMMRNLQTRGATEKGVVIGWSGTFADRVIENEKKGRTITMDRKPLPKKIENYVLKEFGKQIDKNLKLVAETTTITIG